MVRTIFASILFLSVSLVASSQPKLLEHIPLEWKPTSSLRLGTTQMSTSTGTIADVGAFVAVHIRQLFDEAGIKTVDSSGAVLIKGEVTKFFVREGNTYKSEVALQLVVSDADGKTLWKGQASGEAFRFGRSYKAENYYEALSE